MRVSGDFFYILCNLSLWISLTACTKKYSALLTLPETKYHPKLLSRTLLPWTHQLFLPIQASQEVKECSHMMPNTGHVIGLTFDLNIKKWDESQIVSFPAPNPRAGKGLVTLERFLGCAGAWLNRNVMQSITRRLHVATQWNSKS